MEQIRNGICAGINNTYINNICTEANERFGNYYYYILSNAIEDINRVVQYAIVNGISIHQQYFIEQFFADLYHELAVITVPTLIVEMNSKREKNGDRKSEYELFSESLLQASTVKQLYEKYPELLRVSNSIVNNQINYIFDIVKDYVSDQGMIQEKFHCTTEQLICIKITDGDSHNSGKKVAVLKFSNANLIYKPHHLEYDRLFYSILKSMNHSSDVLVKNYIPKFLSKETHAWQEYLINYSCNTIEQIERYYYRLGVLLCNCYLFNCDDIHYENLIANNEFPIIIDLETLVRLSADTNEYIGVLPKVMKEYCTSVLGTLILPTNSIFSTFDFDISGIGGDQEAHSEQWKSFLLVNEGTSDISFEERMFVKNIADNCVKMDGKKLNAKMYLGKLREGFSDAYQFVCKHKDEIREKLNQANMTIRQVLRPTAVYARFLTSSYYPDYLVAKEKRRKLFEKFYKNMLQRENKRVIAEIESLLANDIPYFCAQWNERGVFDGQNNLIVEDYFNVSALDIVLTKLDQFSKKDMEKQLYYIGLSGSTLRGDISELAKIKTKKEWNSTYLDFAIHIGNQILKKLIWNGDSCNFLTLSCMGNRRVISYSGAEMYENGGIILFLAFLGKETNCKQYVKAARGLLKSLDEMKVCDGLIGASVFSGKMSLVYMYFELYQLFHENHDIEKCRNIIMDIEVKECHGYDMISGISSGLILLLNIYQVLQEKFILEKATELGEALMNELDTVEELYTGLAHGASGPAWGLLQLGHFIHEQRFTNKGMELLEYEDQYFEQEQMNWRDIRKDAVGTSASYWCYGATGIGVARIMIGEYIKNDRIYSDIEACVTRLNEEDYIDNYGLCHGIMGKIDVMNLFVKKGFIQERVLNQEIQRVMTNMKREGLYLGDKECFENYTFMLGLSGIGYALLRMHNPEIPCVLALEV